MNIAQKLVLGTAQFGLNYGITNTSGQVLINEIEEILSYARSVGIYYLDTAVAYGNSEELIGRCNTNEFNIVSKISCLHKYEHLDLNKMINQSLSRLKVDSLYGLLLHDEQDLLSEQADEIFSQLTTLKKQGLINKIGVSFYSPDVTIKILNDYPLDIIQIPANQLDNRFVNSGVLKQAKKNKTEVHVRSLYLQGLLVDTNNRPEIFKNNASLAKFDDFANNANISKLALSLAYLFQNPTIDKGVVGCTSVEQLQEQIEAYKTAELSQFNDFDDLSSTDDGLINPALWNL